MKTTAYAYWAAFVAALGGFLQSYVTCAIAGAIRFIADEFSLAPLQEGNLASIILLGAIAGSCFSGSPADKWGRKKCLVVSAFLFLIGSIGVFFVTSYSLLLILRFLIGLAMGTTSILVPLYLAEIAPPKSRGAFVTMFQFAITIGTMVAYLINLFYEPSGNWRIMLALAAFPATIQLVSFLAFPESPKWLFGHGQFEKGNEVLHRLQGTRLEKAEPVEADQATWGSLLKPIFRRCLFIGIILSMFQQLSGINAIIYFTPKIFGEAGLSNAMFSTVLVGIINLISTFISIFLIDRWGRRKLLLWSQVGVALSLLVIVAAFATESSLIDLIAVGAVLTFVGSYSLGMGPVTWVLISEIYPLSIRAKAMGVMTFLSWLSNYLVVLSFPSLLAGFGSPYTFSLYFALAAVALFLFWRFVPETKGKSLEQLEKEILQ
jgi:SP family arabinose:H+ symporter-like MFS transporter